MNEFERRNQENFELAESIIQRTKLLEDRGWPSAEASRYVELHQVWLQTDLRSEEMAQAKELEERHQAPEHFGIFKDRNQETPDQQA